MDNKKNHIAQTDINTQPFFMQMETKYALWLPNVNKD